MDIFLDICGSNVESGKVFAQPEMASNNCHRLLPIHTVYSFLFEVYARDEFLRCIDDVRAELFYIFIFTWVF